MFSPSRLNRAIEKWRHHELLDVQNQMMQQQIELRHRDERIKQLEGEVEARDNTIASLRDYVVDAGDFLARDKHFM